MKTVSFVFVSGLFSSSAFAESVYDATLYAQSKFCENFFAKKCKIPAGTPEPPFKSVDECKADAKKSAEAAAEGLKTKKVTNFGKCKAKIDGLANGDCMSLIMGAASAECME